MKMTARDKRAVRLQRKDIVEAKQALREAERDLARDLAKLADLDRLIAACKSADLRDDLRDMRREVASDVRDDKEQLVFAKDDVKCEIATLEDLLDEIESDREEK